MAKKETFLPPFVPTDLRAWMEADIEERALVGSIRLIQWLEGETAPVYLRTLQTLLGTSGRQTARILAKVKARGWLMSKRGFSATGKGKGAPVYSLAVPTMDFKEARKRLSLQPATDGRLEAFNLPELPFQPATTGRSTIQEIDLKERPKTTPDKPAIAKHPDQDSFWIQAKATWAAKHQGAVLAWPKDARGFNKSLTEELARLGALELARRWGNCVNDPWSRPSLRAFILDTDKWITARAEKGGTHARKFQQPDGSTWTPTPGQD